MKKVLALFLGLIAVMIIGIIGIGFLSNQENDLIHDIGENAKAAAANVVIDTSGYKQKIAGALEENKAAISEATGMSQSEVDAAIADLDIESWQACALPSNAVSTDSISGSYGGFDGTITTYQDPSYITVNTAGQNITLAVPDSAQDYLQYLQYL